MVWRDDKPPAGRDRGAGVTTSHPSAGGLGAFRFWVWVAQFGVLIVGAVVLPVVRICGTPVVLVSASVAPCREVGKSPYTST